MKTQTDRHLIVGIHVGNRVRQAAAIQKVLTACGGCIRTRLGLHEAFCGKASSSGIILLEVIDDEKQCSGMLDRLNAISGVEAKRMVFEH